jgi:hypothetical protein
MGAEAYAQLVSLLLLLAHIGLRVHEGIRLQWYLCWKRQSILLTENASLLKLRNLSVGASLYSGDLRFETRPEGCLSLKILG